VYRAWRALALLILLLVAACGEATPGDTSTPQAPSPEESAAPIASPEPVPSVDPSQVPSVEPSSEPSSESAVGPAAACTGNDDDRRFFADVAEAVDWTVYCPVLPAGWFVDKGQFRLAGGGSMEIAYRGPGGARFEVREGAFCSDGAAACSPHDAVIGPAAFGDREGELGMLGDGLVLYVDPGAVPMWQATGSGLDEATFRAYGEALAIVGG